MARNQDKIQRKSWLENWELLCQQALVGWVLISVPAVWVGVCLYTFLLTINSAAGTLSPFSEEMIPIFCHWHNGCWWEWKLCWRDSLDLYCPAFAWLNVLSLRIRGMIPSVRSVFSEILPWFSRGWTKSW